jgi:pyruvate dehydrogenase kinase 2/3/4
VTIHGRTDLHFTYVPSHISYMLLELLKNSMRATVETHGTDHMPPIKIVIADGEDNEDVRHCGLWLACFLLCGG